MTSNNKDPELIRSDMCQDIVVDGHRFSISIVSSDQHPEWCLEVIDENSMSHVWEATFETDSEAVQAAMIAFEDEGAAGFLQPDTNIVPFPMNGSNKGVPDI